MSDDMSGVNVKGWTKKCGLDILYVYHHTMSHGVGAGWPVSYPHLKHVIKLALGCWGDDKPPAIS
jgi:hypothetical protein